MALRSKCWSLDPFVLAQQVLSSLVFSHRLSIHRKIFGCPSTWSNVFWPSTTACVKLLLKIISNSFNPACLHADDCQHSCLLKGSEGKSQLTEKCPQEPSSSGSVQIFWLVELHSNILPWTEAIWCTPYALERPRSRSPLNNSFPTALQSSIMGWRTSRI